MKSKEGSEHETLNDKWGSGLFPRGDDVCPQDVIWGVSIRKVSAWRIPELQIASVDPFYIAKM